MATAPPRLQDPGNGYGGNRVTARAGGASGTLALGFVLISTALFGLLATPLPAAAEAHTAYVVDRAGGQVIPLDLETRGFGEPIPVGGDPVGVAISPDGKRAYVTSWDEDNVWVIDTPTNGVITKIEGLSDDPAHVAIAPDGKTLYVSEFGTDTVAAIDAQTNTVVDRYPAGPWPLMLAVSPDGRTVYSPNSNGASVSVIDATTGDSTMITAPEGPREVVLTPDGTFAYAVNWIHGSVSVIETETNAIVKNISVDQARPITIAITPNGRTLYVGHWSNPGIISVIDTQTDEVVKENPDDPFPVALAVAPDGRTVYAYCRAAGTIIPINTTTKRGRCPDHHRTARLGRSGRRTRDHPQPGARRQAELTRAPPT